MGARPDPRHPVLLHGFTGSAASWDGVVDRLARLGQVPVTVDLPGHGASPARAPEEASLEAALEVVRGAGRWPADLVGYSMGGRIALHFTLAHPDRVRRLVLESSSPGLESTEERVSRRRSDAALAGRILADGVGPFVHEWERHPLFESQAGLPAAVLERQRERRLANDPQGLAAALIGLGTGALPSLWERLVEVSAPTLLIVGALDRKFGDLAARMAERLPDARLVVVPDAGHAVHVERPEVWADVVGGFLADGR